MCVSYWCAIVSSVTRDRVGPLVFEAAIFSVRYLAACEWTLVAPSASHADNVAAIVGRVTRWPPYVTNESGILHPA